MADITAPQQAATDCSPTSHQLGHQTVVCRYQQLGRPICKLKSDHAEVTQVLKRGRAWLGSHQSAGHVVQGPGNRTFRLGTRYLSAASSSSAAPPALSRCCGSLSSRSVYRNSTRKAKTSASSCKLSTGSSCGCSSASSSYAARGCTSRKTRQNSDLQVQGSALCDWQGLAAVQSHC